MSEPQQRGERSSGTASAVESVELIRGLSRMTTLPPDTFSGTASSLVRRFATWITLHLRKNGGKHNVKTAGKFCIVCAIAVVYCGERALLAASAASGARRARLYWLCKQTASTASTRPFVRPP